MTDHTQADAIVRKAMPYGFELDQRVREILLDVEQHPEHILRAYVDLCGLGFGGFATAIMLTRIVDRANAASAASGQHSRL